MMAESTEESTVLEKFYSDVQKSILDPVQVASLLRQERVAAESLIDEVSPTNRFTLSERTASILRHVEGAVRVNRQSFWAFLAVLEQSGPPACDVAQKMRNAVELHRLGAKKKNGSSSVSDTEDRFVSELYKKDFDGIKTKFLSLHLRISKILSNSDHVTLENLKELLAFYSDLEGPLQAAETITSVMRIVQQHSSVINCSYLEHIAEYFNLPVVSKEIDAYCKRVDEFCQQTIRQHSYVKSFMAKQQNHILSTQTLTLKLEWKPDDKTLGDIRSLIRKTFKSLSDLVHVVVIKEGSVTVICYAPHYIMGTLVQMAKESKSMLLENSVSYLSIGYTVVLDSTDQETKIRDLTQENTALQLKLTALQEQLGLQSEEVELLKSSLESTGWSHSRVMLEGLAPDGIKYLMEHQMIQGIAHFMDETPEQLEAIFQGLKSNTSLRELDISCNLSPVNMSTLSASLTINNTLQSLRLQCHSDLDDHATELLSAALRVNRSLHRLQLGCTVTDTGAQHLATMLTANTTFKKLNLSSLTISDTGILHLSEALKHNSSVKELSFENITDTRAQHLATMITANTTLQTLNLSSSKISDTGILHLSEALKHNNSLTDLDLEYNRHITNTGAVGLSKMLLVNKSLKNLDLYRTSVGEEGAAALMESLLHNQVLTRLKLPEKLKTYCEQHVLYARVKDRVTLRTWL